ncbi:MAG: hypothetical protein FWC61_02920 [Proteobacteria bacterium]|nr:hypothetical protein [Pseudomonadota bacterium]
MLLFYQPPAPATNHQHQPPARVTSTKKPRIARFFFTSLSAESSHRLRWGNS